MSFLTKDEVRAAFGGKVVCPSCGKGDFLNPYPSEREHQLGCTLKNYEAKQNLWELSEAIRD